MSMIPLAFGRYGSRLVIYLVKTLIMSQVTNDRRMVGGMQEEERETKAQEYQTSII